MTVHTVVLGAGFSRAIGGLPLVDELGERVRERVSGRAQTDERLAGVFRSAPSKFEGGSFERWLSRVAEPQPDLGDEENIANQLAFRAVTGAIHDVLVDAERSVIGLEMSDVLERLVTCWHAMQATVLTFNYDTLLERAAARIVNRNARDIDRNSQGISTFALLNNIPPQAVATQYGYGSSPTMRIIKLHGSLDTFWVPGDVAGTTITRLGETSWDRSTGETSDTLDLERMMPGRVPFIVPPASAKSALLANPVTRQLWRTAAERLAASTSIDIVGYSLPMTDLVANAMIAESFRTAKTARAKWMLRRQHGEPRIVVANPNPAPVVESLTAAGVDHGAIRTLADIDEYARQLEDELAAADRHELLEALRSAEHVYVRARDGRRFGTGILASEHVVGDEVTLMMGSDPHSSGADLISALGSSDTRPIVVSRKGQHARVIGHELDDDGALVLIPSRLDGYGRR